MKLMIARGAVTGLSSQVKNEGKLRIVVDYFYIGQCGASFSRSNPQPSEKNKSSPFIDGDEVIASGFIDREKRFKIVQCYIFREKNFLKRNELKTFIFVVSASFIGIFIGSNMINFHYPMKSPGGIFPYIEISLSILILLMTVRFAIRLRRAKKMILDELSKL
ncbi:hypothetical protein [Novosphingobium sp. SG707]|uniref:hypothetical protein n=1 Tax=Novosphingobium sp. SG707 TaxID=2586996 RepID=UPI001447B9A6|nr:hypothetical protein [Novosphingobium sp. SG707]NKJ02982.1 hypothetical protein [Novosphingobium sp. SG707]